MSQYACPFQIEAMLVWHVAVFFFGLCVGSFLNVCVWRLPRGESVVIPPSHCPSCGHGIRWYENIPVLSWLALRGRCSSCGGRISMRYAAVELLTALVFEAVWLKVAFSGAPLSLVFSFFLMSAVLIAATFIDFEHRIIPNELTYSCMTGGIALAAVFPASFGIHLPTESASHGVSAANSAAGLVVAGGLMAFAAWAGEKVFHKEALGWGDVKLMAAVGACFGLLSGAWFFTILVGSLLGTAAGFGLVLLRKGGMKSTIPFGPCLALAGLLWMLAGPEISGAYFKLAKSIALRLL